jgi:signal transduction histidine kinase
MRLRHGNHLPWALALFVPLLAVAVLGGLELRRQGDRAADAVQQQAATFLRGARLHFEEQMRTRIEAALQRAQLRGPNLVEQTRVAIEQGDSVLDLFCLDAKGTLVHPRLALPREPALPFATAPSSDELRLAEHIAQIGDRAALQRARSMLRRYLARPRPAQPSERARASFRLGTVLRQLGELDAADAAFIEASVIAADSDAGPLGVDLLTRIARAELWPQRSTLLELAREISENAWYAVPDELAGAVFTRALAALPEAAQHNGAGHEDELALLRAHESVRRTSRRLAAEFERFAAPAVQRVLQEPPHGPVLRAIGSGAECALLALRPTSANEQAHAGRQTRWLGLRIDLAALANDAMDAFLTPGREGYRLLILDPEGTPILGDTKAAADHDAGDEHRAATGSEGGPDPDDRTLGDGVGDGDRIDLARLGASVAPEAPTLAGLILRAVPVDPIATLRDEHAAVRNRVLILTALVALALAGGFLLVRSVGRDAELSTLKMEFVSRMSHELKTPLSLIKMYGETLALQRAKDAAQAAHFGDIVAREADRLTSQIERMLAFAKQQAGTLRYVTQNVDLLDVVADVVDEYRDHVERTGCTLSLAQLPLAPSPPGAATPPGPGDGTGSLFCAVDPHALHLSLVSLIENSVKYTPPSQADRSIVVTVTRTGGRGVIAVADRGIGIPAAERKRVFTAFYRASNAGEVRGAGLGLSQVQHFVRAHGGEVGVEDNPGGGTIMRLLLPLSRGAREGPQGGSAPPSAPSVDRT